MNDEDFSIRADAYDETALNALSVIGTPEQELLKRLQSSGPILLEGIRGSGKTTLLKIAAFRTNTHASRDVAVYVSFNRYLLLENPQIPIGPTHPFILWVSTKILGAVHDTAKRLTGKSPCIENLTPLLEVGIDKVIGYLETTYKASPTDKSPIEDLPVEARAALNAFHNPEKLRHLLLEVIDAHQLASINLLCDEAAQYFKPEFQPLFFAILKAIHGARISFKAAIYPTVTYFGSDFELGHDATIVTITRPCLSPEWMDFCRGITARRFKEGDLWNSKPVAMQALALSAFGIPRRFIELVGIVNVTSADELTILNVIKEHVQRELFQPFDTLKARIPALVRDVELANYLRHLFVDDLKQENLTRAYKTAYIAISMHRALPYALRKATNLLVYLGVLERQPSCKLGNTRETADRLLINPSLIFAENMLADSSKRRLSLSETIERIRDLQLDKFKEYGRNSKALQEAVDEAVAVDSKPCPQCGTDLPFEARFCTNCGAPQNHVTILAQILTLPSQELDLTPGIKARVVQQFSTVGDVFRASDADLDALEWIGPTRVAVIRHAVDEMISG